MTEENSIHAIRALSLRVRAMRGEASPAAEVEGVDGALVTLAEELGLLDQHHQRALVAVAAETTIGIADLENLHQASHLSTLGVLTAGLAHEIGTPLGIVLARAQMIIGDEVELDEARRDAIEIVAQVKRITRMCSEVLEYARLRPAGKARIDLVLLTRQLVNLMQLDARKRNAKLTFDDDPPPAWVMADASKVTQVLSNLILNAAQSMPRGGAVLISVDNNSTGNIGAVAGVAYVCVHVKDEGTGIGAEILPRIFDTFFTTKNEGSGIGLSVSRRIAREHDGYISVETVEGKGSTFTLGLPAS